eukprot:GHVP01041797.1.p1 GENE.GHVP01041797.1~~GHVP01041797.1.p1  ORF type:complete len:350 (+),score=71.12 GHVP01041797.1:66-1052(+)
MKTDFEKEPTVLYFGFGSNVSDDNLRLKGIECVSRKRAFLPHYRILFNVHNTSFAFLDPAFANLSKLEENKNRKDALQRPAHGIIIEISESAAKLLDQIEAAYFPITVEAEVYAEDGGGVVQCKAYYADEEIVKAIKLKLSYESGLRLAEFPPGYNYLSTIIKGAMQFKLDPSWIECLQNVEYHPIPTADFLPYRKKIFSRCFTTGEIAKSKESGPPWLFSFLGLVISSDEPKLHHFEQKMVGGDMLPFASLRWHSSSGPVTSISDLHEEQLQYAEAFLITMLCRESRSVAGYVEGWLPYLEERVMREDKNLNEVSTPSTTTSQMSFC